MNWLQYFLFRGVFWHLILTPLLFSNISIIKKCSKVAKSIMEFGVIFTYKLLVLSQNTTSKRLFLYYISKYKLIKLHATTREPSYKHTLWIEMKNDGRNKSCPACISLSLCPFYHFCGHLMMCWKEINNVGGISILFNFLPKIRFGLKILSCKNYPNNY